MHERSDLQAERDEVFDDRQVLGNCAKGGARLTWYGFLHILIDAVPEVADVFGISYGAPFYAMMFGVSVVRYARTAYRHDGARVEFI